MRADRGLIGRHPAALAGWLFADLFLVLFITALATEPTSGNVTIPPQTTASSAPPTTASRCPTSYDLVPHTVFARNVSFAGLIDRDPGTVQSLLGQVDQEIAKLGLSDQYAGLLMAWGVAPNAVRQTARDAAQASAEILKANRDKFGRATVLSLNYEAKGADTVRLDIYFFIQC